MRTKILIVFIFASALFFASINILLASRILDVFRDDNNNAKSDSSSELAYYDDEDIVMKNEMNVEDMNSTNAEIRVDVEIGMQLAQPNTSTTGRVVNDDPCKIRKDGHGLKKNEPPRKDFRGRLVYMTIGGANYIPHLEIFVQTLINFDIKHGDIGVVCIDEQCSRYIRNAYPNIMLQEYIHQINGTSCQRNAEISDVRCRVTMGKAESILGRLIVGDAVYFVDADVFFYRHPFESIRVQNAALDLYVQTDGHGNYNFGLFLAYPSKITLGLFQHIKDVFDRNQRWDQILFNDWLKKAINNVYEENNKASTRLIEKDGICGAPYDFEELDMHKYVNTMLKKTYQVDSKVAAAHATCIEGSATKWYAILCFFGSPLKQHYLERKTITLQEDIDPEEDKATLNSLMRALIYIARVTGRSIRIPIPVKQKIDDLQQPFAIISADYLGSLGIDVVEPQFWERAKNRFNRSRQELKIYNFTISDMQYPASNDKYFTADEIQFSFEDLRGLVNSTFGGDLEDRRWSRNATCPHRQGWWCLNICDGSHF